MLPVPTLAYLAQFTGRPENSFTADFADQALTQATLLFSIVTELAEYPDDEDGEQLAINAILEMADRIYLEQPYAEVRVSPFNSETVGSYSYSKGSAYARSSVVHRVQNNEITGLFWWDLAIEQLSAADRSVVSSASVNVFNDDAMYVELETERKRVLGPADFSTPDTPFDINAEMNPRRSF